MSGATNSVASRASRSSKYRLRVTVEADGNPFFIATLSQESGARLEDRSRYLVYRQALEQAIEWLDDYERLRQARESA